MKPFDLKKALAGEKVITRDGRLVTGLHAFTLLKNSNNMETLYGVVPNDDEHGDSSIQYWFDSGKYNRSSTESRYDLFMESKTLWVNVYVDKISRSTYDVNMHGFAYFTKEDADKMQRKDKTRIACIEVED